MSRWLVLVSLLGCQRSYDEQQAARAGSGSGSGGSGSAGVVVPRGAGTERGDCRPDGTCDPGLQCLSSLCVRPPAADCAAIAEQLASLELGNYAPREQRAPVVAAKRAQCEQAMISKDEGKCIAAATDKAAVAACAPRLVPELGAGSGSGSAGGAGVCAQVATKLRAMIATSMGGTTNPDMGKTIDAATTSVRESCEQDGWSVALQQCMLAATSDPDMMKCEPLMGPALQQKLQARMAAAMKPAR